jgi:hypothetical protein
MQRTEEERKKERKKEKKVLSGIESNGVLFKRRE